MRPPQKLTRGIGAFAIVLRENRNARKSGSGRPDLSGCLPATGGEEVFLLHLANVEAGHGFAQSFTGFEDGFGIFEVRGGFYHSFGASFGIAGFENAGTYEDRFRAEFAHESSVGGSGKSAR